MFKKIKHNTIFILLSLFIMIIFVFLGIYVQEKDSINTLKFVVKTDETSEKISLFNTDNKYYAFLPSYADMDDVNLEYSSGSVYIDDQYFYLDTSLSELKTENEYNVKIKNFLGLTVCDETLIIMKSENIPSLSIHLTNGTLEDINNSKEVEKKGVCTLINENKKIDYEGQFKSIHGRGNTTWGEEKKPYNIAFENDVNLLNMGSGKNYSLLANSFDESNLRNKIVYDIAKKIEMPYSVDSEYVDLYINEEYCGLYLLTEKIEIAKNRVDITDLNEKTQSVNMSKLDSYEVFLEESNLFSKKGYNIPNNPEDITGGYILETQLSTRIDSYDSYLKSGNNTFYSLKSPAYVSKEQLDYLENELLNFENSLSGKYFKNYINVDSWVKYYLTEEIFLNCDAWSIMIYKNSDSIDNKIYASPLWDFDLSIGLGLGVYKEKLEPNDFVTDDIFIFKQLKNNKLFTRYVVDFYKTKYKNILTDLLINKIDKYKSIISKSYLLNSKRWNIKSSIEENTEYIKDFLKERTNIINDLFIEQSKYNIINYIFKDDVNNVNLNFSKAIKKGEDNIETPILKFYGYKFLGWYDTKTGQKVENEKAYTNKTLYAKWKKINDTKTSDSTEIVNENASNRMEYVVYLCFGLMTFIVLILFVKNSNIFSYIKRSRRYKDEE